VLQFWVFLAIGGADSTEVCSKLSGLMQDLPLKKIKLRAFPTATVQWQDVFKRTQWPRYQALEAPGQVARLALTRTALPLSHSLELT
jgi:hypothetical protein